MAIRNVIEREGSKFFSLNASYTIHPESTPGQLFNDFDCLADSGMAVLLDVVGDVPLEQEEKLYAAYFLLQQAIAAHSKAHKMLFTAGKLDS